MPKSAKIATLACLALLAASLVINNILAGFNFLVLLFQLALPGMTLPGLLRDDIRSAQWLCFIVLFFLVNAILVAFTPGRLLAGLIEALICLLLFISAIIFIRNARHSR